MNEEKSIEELKRRHAEELKEAKARIPEAAPAQEPTAVANEPMVQEETVVAAPKAEAADFPVAKADVSKEPAPKDRPAGEDLILDLVKGTIEKGDTLDKIENKLHTGKLSASDVAQSMLESLNPEE